MSDWKSVYEIRYHDRELDLTHISPPDYELVHLPTGKIVARYKDYKYARKQARYRYRKDTKRMEKILFSGDMDAKEDLPTMVDST